MLFKPGEDLLQQRHNAVLTRVLGPIARHAKMTQDSDQSQQALDLEALQKSCDWCDLLTAGHEDLDRCLSSPFQWADLDVHEYRLLEVGRSQETRVRDFALGDLSPQRWCFRSVCKIVKLVQVLLLSGPPGRSDHLFSISLTSRPANLRCRFTFCHLTAAISEGLVGVPTQNQYVAIHPKHSAKFDVQ